MSVSSLFVSAWLPRQQQSEVEVRMKRRCVPLRADHDLLTPDTHTVLGVSRHPVEQVRSGGVACLSEHLSNLSDSQFATKSSRRFPAVSTTRRLRFEDETETEAESRYLERQRQRRRGVLVSKPDLNLYVNGGEGTEPQGAGRVSNRQQRGGAGQCVTCQSDLKLCLNPPVPVERGRSLYRPRLNLRTEPIRESYIGSVTPADTSGGGGSAGRDANNQVRRKTNGNRTTIPQASPAADLPINPYAPNLLTTNTLRCPSSLSPPPVTSLLTSQSINGQKEEQRSSAAPLTDRNLQASVERAGRSPGGELKKSSSSSSSSGRSLGGESKKSSSSSSSGRSPSNTAERQAPPPSDSCRQPMRAALHSDETLSLLEYVINRDESSRLSLRRLLSSVRLSGTRTSSLDRLCSRPRPSVSEPTYSCPGKTSGVPKKMPSVPPLNVGTSFLQLRKSLSVESFGLEQKKTDRSADYRPAADQFLQRCLSIEDVGRPSSVRSVGRVLQVCSDGTFLLEVSQPKNRIYGFIISRGRGRPDSGVYVEDMVDSSTEKLYAGLLAVGDEILEVNGEKVACLSLDQVTHLLTQNTSATIRTLRHRPTTRGHLPPPDHLTT